MKKLKYKINLLKNCNYILEKIILYFIADDNHFFLSYLFKNVKLL